MASIYSKSEYAFNGFEPPGRTDITKRVSFVTNGNPVTHLEFTDWAGERRWAYLVTLLMWEIRTGPRNMFATETISIAPALPLVTPTGERLLVRIEMQEAGPVFSIDGMVDRTRKYLGTTKALIYINHTRQPVPVSLIFTFPMLNLRIRRANDAGKYIDTHRIKVLDWNNVSQWYTMAGGVWKTDAGQTLTKIPVVYTDGIRGTLGLHADGSFVCETMGFPSKEFPPTVSIHSDIGNVVEMTLISLDKSASDSGFFVRLFDDMIDSF